MTNEELVKSARKAAERAYCPYSNFRVGAAVMCTDGTAVLGCNVENASYGLTICAERSALFSAIAQRKTPKAIAIACPGAKDADNQYKMPCGACRQVMIELLPEDALVLIASVGAYSTSELLPEAFKL
jgi:cytidine deaminase